MGVPVNLRAQELRPLSELQRQSVEAVVGGLKASSNHQQIESAEKMLAAAASFGLNLRDYLTLAIDPRAESPNKASYAGLTGYEAALAHLNLPLRENLAEGVVLQAASETFQTFPGTRALFPEVLDDMLRSKTRLDTLENTANLVSQTRVIAGSALITTYLEDDATERKTYTVPELGRIPIRTIRTSQNMVEFFKHGSAYQTSYEFNRRASLDIVTPFAARVARELELSKVAAATGVLINGDGVNPAATSYNMTSYGADFSGGKTLKDNYKALAKFLVDRAKAGYPVDTIACNLDTYFELVFMFDPVLAGYSSAQVLADQRGLPKLNSGLPILNQNINIVISSSVPANKMVCFIKAETLEELMEAGSDISENEKSIRTQSILYVRTQNTGYKLAFPDTRFVLNAA